MLSSVVLAVWLSLLLLSVSGQTAPKWQRPLSRALLRNATLSSNNQSHVFHPTTTTTSGWITAAGTDFTAQKLGTITSFVSTWVVPPAPVTSNGQTLFIWNGLQDSAGNAVIQPVLEWDSNLNSWGAQCWYVYSGGSQTSSRVTVSPGTQLVGLTTLNSVSGSSYTYECQFQGISGTQLTISNMPLMNAPFIVLETYGVPESQGTTTYNYNPSCYDAFTSVAIKVGSAEPSYSWSIFNFVQDVGEYTSVVSNANPGGQVNVYSSNSGLPICPTVGAAGPYMSTTAPATQALPTCGAANAYYYGTGSESVTAVGFPTTAPSSGSFSVQVNYNNAAPRVVHVDLCTASWNCFSTQNSGVLPTPAGTGSVQIEVTVSNAPASSNGYVWSVWTVSGTDQYASQPWTYKHAWEVYTAHVGSSIAYPSC